MLDNLNNIVNFKTFFYLKEMAMKSTNHMDNKYIVIHKNETYKNTTIILYKKPHREILNIMLYSSRIFNNVFCCHAGHSKNNKNYIGSGYGPLLYDIAMEYATSKGKGLMSSTGGGIGDTSELAENIYKYYYNNRNDITKNTIYEEFFGSGDIRLSNAPWLRTIFYKPNHSIIDFLQNKNKIIFTDKDLLSNTRTYDQNITLRKEIISRMSDRLGHKEGLKLGMRYEKPPSLKGKLP